MKEYDLIVFIGRFQPIHKGHMKVIEEACDKADNVLISVGSSNVEPSLKNPLTAEERVNIIQKNVFLYIPSIKLLNTEVFVQTMQDYPTDEAWVFNMRNKVDKLINEGRSKEAKIGIIGFEKDDSSYYLRLFPEWDLILTDGLDIMNATDIREILFSKEFSFIKNSISPFTFEAFINSENYDMLRERKEVKYVESQN